MPALYLLLCLTIFSLPAEARSRDPLDYPLPEMEVMPSANWYWVGQRMALNNIPMSIKMFAVKASVADVEKFYLSAWKVKGHGKATNKSIGSMKILGYELDGIQYSAQFSQNNGMVEGKLVVSPTPLNYKANRKTSLPVAPRTDVTSKVESIELGRRSETLTLESSLGVEQLLLFYTSQLENLDWHQYSQSGDGHDGAVLSFQKGGELLQLTVKRLQGRNTSFCQILIHWLK